MNTQVVIIVVIILGLLAAISAAVLVVFMRFEPVREAVQAPVDPDVKVLVAKDTIPPMTVLEETVLEVRTMPRSEAPANRLSNPTQVAGRITSVPLQRNQPVTNTSLVPLGSGYQLAGNLPTGKRAVSVVLAGDSGLAGLLYPGCIVDVLVSFDLGGGVGTAVTTTLYNHVEVLAIGSLTAEAVQKAREAGEPASPGGGPNLMVTLLVDSEQAKGIQLATDNGRVSLAMRNPNDKMDDLTDAKILNIQRLALFGELMADASEVARRLAPPEKDTMDVTVNTKPEPDPPVLPPEPREGAGIGESSELSIGVLRGTSLSTVTFTE